jgi:hypothetical protein
LYPVVIRGSGENFLEGRCGCCRACGLLLCVLGSRAAETKAGPKAARERWRWAALWPSPTCGMAAAAASGPGPGEKSQHTERAATLATGLRGLLPVLSLLGRLVETRCSCRRGGPPALFHRETRRLCGRRARGPAARPASLRKGRISTRPGRPLSSSGSSPASRKPRRSLLMRRTSCG